MKISCPHCHQRLEAGNELAGMATSCPHCGRAFDIPGLEATPQQRRPSSAAASGRRSPMQMRPSGSSYSTVSSRRNGGPGFGKLLQMLLLIGMGAFIATMVNFHESPRQVLERLKRAAEGPSATPGPESQPMPAVALTPTPVPASSVIPAPSPTAAPVLDSTLAWLLENTERCPKEVALAESVEFPIKIQGRPAGFIKVRSGTVVRVLEVRADAVLVSFRDEAKLLPIPSTDLIARAAREMTKPVAGPGGMGDAKSGANSSQIAPVARMLPTPLTDTVVFGDSASENAHALQGENSEVIQGGLGEPARRLLPGGKEPWEGGRMRFTMKVDPSGLNYFTIRLWGSETGNSNHLLLYCEGKQIGYLHLGDIEALDSASDSPPFLGRFFYNTVPLPTNLTKGRSELHCEIRSLGRIWSYGQTFEQYQKPMIEPTRGIYRVYTHADSCFVPPADEKQGAAPTNVPVRREPGEEALVGISKRVGDRIKAILDKKGPPTQHELWLLARAYFVNNCPAYRNPRVVQRVVEGIDALYVGWLANPQTAMDGPSMYNAGWFGFGPAGQSVALLAEPLKPFLDEAVEGGKGEKRRAGWAAMFSASRDIHRENRRQYTNQSMINDTYGIYLNNRGVAVLAPEKALPEEKARHYLYESCGIEPWLGSEVKGRPTKPLGEEYYQLTAKGLTKELGFVGYYGEVLDWMTAMYEATRPRPDLPGDPKIKAQLVKIALARSPFRYPELDPQGNRAMLAETIIGWRDQGHYPGNIIYAQRPTWDATTLDAAAATLDPRLVGYVQQMFADNQFFGSLPTDGRDLRIVAGALDAQIHYDQLKALPPSHFRLPMTAGQPDFVFADEEDGCVAIKNNGEILYASLYWRARNAINFLARIHYIQPQIDRIAVVRQDVEFTDSGKVFVRPNWTNFGFGNGGLKYPGECSSAHAGESLPIASVPKEIAFKPGQENVHAGRGDFYKLRYGSYLIGMNTTKARDFHLEMPQGVTSAKELVSGKIVTGGVKVGPDSTVVLYFPPPQSAKR